MTNVSRGGLVIGDRQFDISISEDDVSARLIKNTLMKEKPGFISSDQSMGGIIYGSVLYFRS